MTYEELIEEAGAAIGIEGFTPDADGICTLVSDPRLGSISTFMAILLLMIVEYLQRDKVHVLQFSSGNRWFRYAVARWTVYLAMLVAIFYFYFNTVSQEFIYFQF